MHALGIAMLCGLSTCISIANTFQDGDASLSRISCRSPGLQPPLLVGLVSNYGLASFERVHVDLSHLDPSSCSSPVGMGLTTFALSLPGKKRKKSSN